MDILVIGNGFDLAHGLPTSYVDFLNIIHKIKTHYSHSSTKEIVSQFESIDSLCYREFEEIIKSNILIAYFLSIYEERFKEGKKGWIDFEHEISVLVKALYDLKHDLTKREYNHQDIMLSRNKLDFFIHESTPRFSLIDIQSIDLLSEVLQQSLSRLIRALEIYLTMIIPQKTVFPIEHIKNLSVNYLLSFNYTDTFERYYNKGVECCYIHGKAQLKHGIEECNLVLGIDEFLPEGIRDNNNEFEWFKKFYQRIFKHTDSNYLDWIEEIEPVLYGYNNIYIYGHSLDVTDKDVLSKLILAERVKTHIFYHNPQALSSYISNLVKIVGEENLIKMTAGRNRAIEFIPTF